MGRKQSWSSEILIISVPELRSLDIVVFNSVREKKKSYPLSCGFIKPADCSVSNVVLPAALLEQDRISPPSLFARNPNIYGVNCALKLRFGSWQFHF